MLRLYKARNVQYTSILVTEVYTVTGVCVLISRSLVSDALEHVPHSRHDAQMTPIHEPEVALTIEFRSDRIKFKEHYLRSDAMVSSNLYCCFT